MLAGFLLKLLVSRLGDRRGGVIVFVAVGMGSSLWIGGLAIDLGRGYLLKAHLSRAADAAALAAARALRAGPTEAEARARAVAEANGVEAGLRGATLSLRFGTNELDEETVTVTASLPTPTLLMKLAGQDMLKVRSAAVAAVPPVDLVLVLDQSGSLDEANAWDDLQDAAKQFVSHFDDEIDQMGLVTFNLRAEAHFPIKQPFRAEAEQVIDTTNALGYTNAGEGLRLAYELFQGPSVRDRSAKVVVFFTDGRPTAYRGGEGLPMDKRDRLLATYSGPNVMGYWNNPDDVPMHIRPPADGCVTIPVCFGYIRRSNVFENARENGAYWADRIRADGVFVYTVGLGDTSRPPGSILQPDQDYLRELANEDGFTNPEQLKGNMYFAPSAGEIRTVFSLLAQDLFARLTR
jgi:Flp pilus assembly protein TadG